MKLKFILSVYEITQTYSTSIKTINIRIELNINKFQSLIILPNLVKSKVVPNIIDIRNKACGVRHFAIKNPYIVRIDLDSYSPKNIREVSKR